MSGKTDVPHVAAKSQTLGRVLFICLLFVVFIIQTVVFKTGILHRLTVVYPIAYLGLLIRDILHSKLIRPIEMWLAVNATWVTLIAWPHSLIVSVPMFGIVIWVMRKTFWAWWSVFLFLLMCYATVLYQR